jgi:uncharacterized protein YxjI
VEEILSRNVLLVKEHVGFFKVSSEYDVIDPETGQIVLYCREPNLGTLTKAFRFTKYRNMTPFDVHITTPEGELVVQVTRGLSLFLSQVQVHDGEGAKLGSFRQKLLSVGGSFSVLDAQDEPMCDLKGKWTGWEFRFMTGSQEFACVTKKWNGIGKELFTSADSYVLQISDAVPAGHPLRRLILGAVLTIDRVLKEK